MMNELPLPSLGPWDLLFSHCDILTLVYLSWTCHALKDLVDRYKRRAYRAHWHRLLARFFSLEDIVEFRKLQAKTDFIISGSFALQFFLRTEWSDSDLDLYVYRKDEKDVIAFLTQCGYDYTPESGQNPDIEGGISFRALYEQWGSVHIDNVRTFKNGDNKVQIIICRSSIIATILGFHSTAVMNCITATQAYCFYPIETLVNMRSIVTYERNPPKPALVLAAQKYSKRGWDQLSMTRLFNRVSPRELYEMEFHLDELRWVGDDKCLTVPLDISPVVPESVMLNSWALKPTLGLAVHADFVCSAFNRKSKPTPITVSFAIETYYIRILDEASRDVDSDRTLSHLTQFMFAGQWLQMKERFNVVQGRGTLTSDRAKDWLRSITYQYDSYRDLW